MEIDVTVPYCSWPAIPLFLFLTTSKGDILGIE